MLDAVGPELVVVATTANAHAELTCLAFERGAKLVLSEKPLATSLADCDRMLAAAEAAGGRLAVNHQMRFMEQYTTPKSLLDSEEFGGLVSWSVIAGNFGLANNGTHYLEAFRYLAGEPAVEISAWLDPAPVPSHRGPQFADHSGVLRAVTASGVRLHLDASVNQGHGMIVTYAARHGWIAVDELDGQLRLSVRDADQREMPTTRYGMPHRLDQQAIAPADNLGPTRAVVQALIAGEDYPDGQTGRDMVAALVAANVSQRENHRAVRLDEPLPRDEVFPWA